MVQIKSATLAQKSNVFLELAEPGDPRPVPYTTTKRYRPVKAFITYTRSSPASPWEVFTVRLVGRTVLKSGDDGHQTGREDFNVRDYSATPRVLKAPDWVLELVERYRPQG